MRPNLLLGLALLSGAMPAVVSAPAGTTPSGRQTFTVLSHPITLAPTEVHNRAQPPVALPEDVVQRFRDGRHDMVIKEFYMDIVDSDDPDATAASVPLYELYNHHFVLYMGDTGEPARNPI